MSRVLLGVTGGIAAYKACELLRRLRADGHDVTVVPTAAALEFVGAATWAALSGTPGAHLGVRRRAPGAARPARPGGRPGRSSRRPPPTCWPGPPPGGPTTCSPTCCSPRAARSCTPRPCTPRCGCTRPPRPTSTRCAPAGRVVVDPDSGPADRRRLRTRAAARSGRAGGGRRRRAGRPGDRPPRGRARPGRADASRSAPAAPGSTWTRSASSATPRRAGWAGRWPGPRCCAGPRCASWPRNVTLPAPPSVEVEPVISTADLAAAMEVAAKGADLVVMAAAPADFTPAETSQTKIKKSGDGGSARSTWCRPPTCWPAWSRPAPTRARCWSASPPRPRPGASPCSSSVRPSWPARAATCWC